MSFLVRCSTLPIFQSNLLCLFSTPLAHFLIQPTLAQVPTPTCGVLHFTAVCRSDDSLLVLCWTTWILVITVFCFRLIPVQYEQYGKEYMQITGQDNFDGFRLEASKQVTPQLQASHSFFLGTTMREEGHIYQFGPTFALDDGRLFLMGRYGDDGITSARLVGIRKM